MKSVSGGQVAHIVSGAPIGFDGALIEVEADIKAGLPTLQIVGMGNKAIDEARQRVRSAIANSLLTFPAQKVIVNLAPAELPKDGTHLDLPIALSILVASGQLTQKEVSSTLFAGELSLNGNIRPIKGAITLAELAKSHKINRLILPHHNVAQASLVTGINIIGVSSLQELYMALKGVSNWSKSPVNSPDTSSGTELGARIIKRPEAKPPLLDEIIGHEQAKRAISIAVAGRHNVLLSGPPGVGKSMLAKATAGLMPPLSEDELTDVAKIHSITHGDEGQIQYSPPFRAPHHGITVPALIGGGLRPRPGELSLAHKGILFLDELPEFPRDTLEALRQPLEDKSIRLTRLHGAISYPADVLLIATMNPCPCGFLEDSGSKKCTCLASQISAYKKKLSGPLLDRIDLRVKLYRPKQEHFFSTKSLIKTQQVKVLMNIKLARKAQALRYNRRDYYNAYASLEEAQNMFKISKDAELLITQASKKLELSARATLRVIRVARTIADIENSPTVDQKHVAEALQFR